MAAAARSSRFSSNRFFSVADFGSANLARKMRNLVGNGEDRCGHLVGFKIIFSILNQNQDGWAIEYR